MRALLRITTTVLLFALISPFSAIAQEKMSVAVAANYISAFKEIAAAFEEKSGVKVEGTFSSTGSLYNQIKNGAPYDLFLSADDTRPQLLHDEGLGDEPFIYARGRAILWSSNHDFCAGTDWKEAIKGSSGKISIANPVTAPYGAVAMKAVEEAGMAELLNKRFVTAQTVAQSFQYASTGAVDAGFCALSAIASEEGQGGCFYPIPEAAPVVQAACILERTEIRDAVERFAAFLISEEALAIMQTFGYE
ncbi:MAG: molybdate ABC transporter substrate-binding protein [Syntrophales bacterium]|jgi:molybdate transport system substrate-binding protein|nr:molybdate ABC transporter substrate-binding protein [Syntrophales bacterium]MCK9527074.1 molybdate ABC transporter substrate-binding protein [Syntrophales bacterium]MDX9921801.1 molybdate ABC transporter substrate-binding protein [Syntrophales bacterium]